MRIVGGKFKGKKLFQFDYDNIRPTSDLVKEAVFNVLQNEIKDCVFLDLFGGTGNVGFEALSRGAEKVFICDSSANSIKLIKKNNELFNGQAVICHSDFKKSIADFSKKGLLFDIIFLDPPYATTFGVEAIELIKQLNVLREGGLIVFEHHKDTIVEFPQFCDLYSEKKYGIKVVKYIEFK